MKKDIQWQPKDTMAKYIKLMQYRNKNRLTQEYRKKLRHRPLLDNTMGIAGQMSPDVLQKFGLTMRDLSVVPQGKEPKGITLRQVEREVKQRRKEQAYNS
jgi:hypothetical protein